MLQIGSWTSFCNSGVSYISRVVFSLHRTSRGSVSFKIARSRCWISTTSQNDVFLIRWCWHVALATVMKSTGLLAVLKSNRRHVTRLSYLDWEHKSCSRVTRSNTVALAVINAKRRQDDVFWFSGYKGGDNSSERKTSCDARLEGCGANSIWWTFWSDGYFNIPCEGGIFHVNFVKKAPFYWAFA